MDASLDGLADEDAEDEVETQVQKDLKIAATPNGAEESAASSPPPEESAGTSAPKRGAGRGGASRGRGRPAAKRLPENSEQEAGQQKEDMPGIPCSKKGAPEDQQAKAGKAAKEKAKSGKDAASAPKIASEECFKAVEPLHLGLGLKIGDVYSASELRQKCLGNKTKLASLEKFMKDPNKLAPVAKESGKKGGRQRSRSRSPKPSNPPPSRKEGGGAQKVQTKSTPVVPAQPSKSAAPARAPVASPPRKRRRENSTDNVPLFCAQQVIWHAAVGKLARVSSVPDELDDPYSIQYLDGDDAATSPTYEVGASDLQAFDAKELPKILAKGKVATSCAGSPMADVLAAVPGVRKSEDFKVGQIVWYLGPGRPSWPARIQMLPPDRDDKSSPFRIQLFNTKGGSEDGEVLPAEASQLLTLEKEDPAAFFQVAQVLQKALSK
jgi:hypothetical protein